MARTSTTSSATWAACARPRALPEDPGPRGVGGDRGRRRRTVRRTSRQACGSRSGRTPRVAHCYPCRIGRGNACVHLNLIGIHRDGALQERLVMPAEQAFPVGDQDAVSAAIVEPMSIAVRAVVRGRVAPARRLSSSAPVRLDRRSRVAATDRGAYVLLIDPIECGSSGGARPAQTRSHVEPGADPVAAAREWAGGDGPEVVFEATGVADDRPDRRRARRLGRPRRHRRPRDDARAARDRTARVQGGRRPRHEHVQRRRLRGSDLPRRAPRGGARRLRHARVLARGSARGDRVRDRASCRRDEGRDQTGRALVTLRALDERRAAAMEALCELIVPGSSKHRPGRVRRRAHRGHAASGAGGGVRGDRRARAGRRGGGRGASRARGNAGVRVRARARDRGVLQRLRRARQPGAGRVDGDRLQQPLATRLAKDWSYLGIA